MRRPILAIGGGLLAVAALSSAWLLSLRGRPSPEAEVKRTLQEVERAVERLDFARALRFVSPGYRDSAGNNYLTLRRAALRAKREVASIFVAVPGGWQVEVEGGRATAKGRVFYYAISRSGEADRDWLDLTVRLRRERGGWKVFEADGLPSLE